MFLSQDGVVLCTTLRAMDELGILDPSLREDWQVADLCPELTEAGFGALRVALHGLHSTGWLTDPPALDPTSTVMHWTEAGRLAAGYRELYVALGDFLAGFPSAGEDAWRRPWEPAQGERFGGFIEAACDRWRLDPDLPADLAALIRAHLNSALIVPMMLWLHETGRLGDDGPTLPQGRVGEAMGRLLVALEWLAGTDGDWTESGHQACAFALNFGGVATYLPLLSRLPALYRGELAVESGDSGKGEWHVHRELNLTISAKAHRRYFADSDPIFLELFDREPIDAQPSFIADTGCGDGSWLIHVHDLIARRTLRGEWLDSHPLALVAIDPDPKARVQSQRNFAAAGISALVIPGDVTDPDGLRVTLAEHDLAIEDGLHIRAFIDHERTYLGSDVDVQVPGWTSGVYLDGDGRPLGNEEVERDLITHMRRWERHVGKHGMVVLEAHCVAPHVVARHPGSLHGIAFDAHQAYSKQYPVDHPAFLRCCHLAGLQSVGHFERRYPVAKPFVSISLNRLLALGAKAPLPAMHRGSPRRDTWSPDPESDLEDGRALQSILFEGSDIRYPAAWCSMPTGFVVAGALDVIEAHLRATEKKTIRVLDYGAGTGTATIELAKACREGGIEARLKRLGMALELHLIDLPSSWFAQGYELLRDCEWTHFHSLRAKEGDFRSLLEVMDGETVDVVMANMVFHLIPPRALERSMDELANVLAPGGRLIWSAPDLGPPGPSSVLLHDPNRALREHWLELLDHSLPTSSHCDGQALSPDLEEAIRHARESLDGNALRKARDRADRRIRPRPLATDITTVLKNQFSGEIELRAYEMPNEEIVRGLLVPSNQAEYLPEIPDRELREQVIHELMLHQVLPAMQEGPAGTALGLNLHWTLGAFSRLP